MRVGPARPWPRGGRSARNLCKHSGVLYFARISRRRGGAWWTASTASLG